MSSRRDEPPSHSRYTPNLPPIGPPAPNTLLSSPFNLPPYHPTDECFFNSALFLPIDVPRAPYTFSAPPYIPPDYRTASYTSPAPPYIPHNDPTAASSSRSTSFAIPDPNTHLLALVEQRQKIGPIEQQVPDLFRLLSREIFHVIRLSGTPSVLDQCGLQLASFLGSYLHGGANVNRLAPPPQPEMQYPRVVRKTLKLDIEVQPSPYYSFRGLILGPGGNTVKLIEKITRCRVVVIGQGSMKPQEAEEVRGKPGFEDLNEPLQILVTGILPVGIIHNRLTLAREMIVELLNPVETLSIRSKIYSRQLC